MPTEEQNDRVNKMRRYVFLAAMIAAAVAALFFMTISKIVAVRVFVTAFWLLFASKNGAAFYSGRLQWKGKTWGFTFAREQSPILFYALAVLSVLVSMSIATFLLWKAYTAG